MNIEFNVVGQSLAKRDIKLSDMKPGTRGVAKLLFSFDSSWSDYRAKAVSFSHDGEHFDIHEPIKGNSVLIPDQFCDADFYFKITGSAGKKRFVSEKARVIVHA